MDKIQKKWFVLVGLIALIVIWRSVDHIGNFAPVAAAALFASFYLRSVRLAILVPVLGLFISDLFVGAYDVRVAIAVYIGLASPVFLAGWLIRKENKRAPFWKKMLRVVAIVPLGSVIFFLVSNLAVWWFTPMYAHTTAGLVLCYEAALPFFRQTLMGDWFFSGVLFGVYYLLANFEEEETPGKLKPIKVRSK